MGVPCSLVTDPAEDRIDEERCSLTPMTDMTNPLAIADLECHKVTESNPAIRAAADVQPTSHPNKPNDAKLARLKHVVKKRTCNATFHTITPTVTTQLSHDTLPTLHTMQGPTFTPARRQSSSSLKRLSPTISAVLDNYGRVVKLLGYVTPQPQDLNHTMPSNNVGMITLDDQCAANMEGGQACDHPLAYEGYHQPQQQQQLRHSNRPAPTLAHVMDWSGSRNRNLHKQASRHTSLTGEHHQQPTPRSTASNRLVPTFSMCSDATKSTGVSSTRDPTAWDAFGSWAGAVPSS